MNVFSQYVFSFCSHKPRIVNQIFYTLTLLVTCLLLSLPVIGQAQPPQSGQDNRSFQRVVGVDESSGNTYVNYDKLSKDKELEVAKLVSMYQQTTSDEKLTYRKQLMVALEELFEINLNKKEDELKALEEELADVRRGLEFRQMNKRKIVENRLKELIDN